MIICTMQLQQQLLRKMSQTCKQYGLIADGDRLLVGLSGGKDSLALLDLLVLRSHILKPSFSVEAAYVRMTNISYASDESYLLSFARQRDVVLHVVETSFDPSTDRRHQPCFLCSWNRRKQLFALAQRLGCNKLALGHHRDDILQTALMNLCFTGQFSSMPPMLRMNKFDLAIVRPLCEIRERLLGEYAAEQQFLPQKVLCPYDDATRRADMKHIVEQLEAMNPELEYSVWHALQRVRQRQD